MPLLVEFDLWAGGLFRDLAVNHGFRAAISLLPCGGSCIPGGFPGIQLQAAADEAEALTRFQAGQESISKQGDHRFT